MGMCSECVPNVFLGAVTFQNLIFVFAVVHGHDRTGFLMCS